MSTTDIETTTTATDVALCWLRITGCLLLLSVHGLPKLLHFDHELGVIEDPFGLGSWLTLSLAIFAEVLCPVFIVLGVLTRLATLPVLFLLAVSVIWVHPEWSLAEGQFAWLLLIVFSTIFVAGPGRLALGTRLAHHWPLLREL
ncbi:MULTISPECIES: DoxX family protein [Pseudomonas]|uniref:DoxX family protein n=1 Tax=Pseudomonas izuensis TaxID=2684212 RepID=A0ABM7RTY9_9PSED|nr:MULTISPECIES: DoxX family protein [Pseudomonas]RKS24897.1 putative oxidoreductase [Pseudomonas sp. WPR_5_2]BCX69016.1 DoxX family protein [Pseudomonas izuensis]